MFFWVFLAFRRCEKLDESAQAKKGLFQMDVYFNPRDSDEVVDELVAEAERQLGGLELYVERGVVMAKTKDGAVIQTDMTLEQFERLRDSDIESAQLHRIQLEK